jgi:teichuronic acid biosynthesis glycosyltransferase TuaG
MTAVNVVIPAYNASRWIAETIESVLAQDFHDFEVVVVDDGSIDDTAAVVARFKQVQYILKSNGGEGSARNTGIRATSGEYVACVDADDLWLPDKLRVQTELLRETGLAWAYSDGYAFDSSSGHTLYTFSEVRQHFSGDILRPLLLEDFIPCPTPVIKRSVFEAVGYFDESRLLRMRADWDMWLRIAARYPIGYVGRPLVRYRIHSGSGSNSEPPSVAFESHLAVIERAVSREPERLAPLRKRAMARQCIAAGRIWLGQGDLTMARAMFAQSIRLFPRYAQSYPLLTATLLGRPLVTRLIAFNHRRRDHFSE